MDKFSDTQRLDWVATHRKLAALALESVSGMQWTSTRRVKFDDDFARLALREVIDRYLIQEMRK